MKFYKTRAVVEGSVGKTMKKLIFIGLIAIMIPQVVFAAWWNPFSWKIFQKTDIKTQTLENRIQELEKKLENKTVTPTSTTVKSSNPTTETKKAEIKTPIKNTQAASPKSVKTFTTPNGAVIDEAGNIISPAKNNPAQPPAVSLPIPGSRGLTSEEIYSVVSPAVVYITNSKGHGTGFIIKDGRYTITNAHVVGNDQTVKIRLSNGVIFTGIVLGKDIAKDIALIFNGNQRPPTVVFGESDPVSLKVGSDVYALGFPLDYTEIVTLTRGVVSASRQQTSGGIFIQTDATIHPGNSGGPLVNNKGQIIGINSQGLSALGTVRVIGGTGIGFAIPIETVIDLIPSLSQYGQSRYELYPIGSTLTIPKSISFRIELNDDLSCAELGFVGNDLALCNLYKNYKNDYKWIFKEDLY